MYLGEQNAQFRHIIMRKILFYGGLCYEYRQNRAETCIEESA